MRLGLCAPFFLHPQRARLNPQRFYLRGENRSRANASAKRMRAKAAASDLTTGDIGAHLRQLAWPASIGFFFNTLYNITDTFYAGLLSTEAQESLGFSFPLFFLLLALCVGLGRAATAAVGNALGGGRGARARFFVGQTALLAAAATAMVWIFCLPATGPLLAALGAKGQTLADADAYSRIVYWGAPFFLGSFALNGFLQAGGDARAFRDSLIAANALNLVLDPALMFGWFGLPALGVAGIAIATVIAQALGFAYLALAYSKTALARRNRALFWRPRRSILADLTLQALAPAANMLAIGGGFFIIIGYLARFGGDVVAGYTVALRIEQMFLLPGIGINIALLATASQNLGAREIARARLARKIATRFCLSLAACGAGGMLLLGGFGVWIFNRDPAVIAAGYGYLVAASILGPFYGLLHTSDAVLQAAHRARSIAVVGVLRLVVAPLTLFWLFAEVAGWGVYGVWAGLVVANVAAALAQRRRATRTLHEIEAGLRRYPT